MLRLLEQAHSIRLVARIQLDASVFQGIVSGLPCIAGGGMASKQHQAHEKGESYEQFSLHSDKNSEFAAITTFFPTFAARKERIKTRDCETRVFNPPGPLSRGSRSRVSKSRSQKTTPYYNMITADQLKDVCKRIDALRRYL